jgi:hypothetical protein
VVHDRERLSFGLKASDDLFGVHAGLDDLERDSAAHGAFLLGQVDGPHAPLTDALE